MKYQINDTVCYGTNGVCRISAIEQHSFTADPSEYYILRPVYDASSTIFVPLNNPALCGRMRPVMTQEQLVSLIRRMTAPASEWIEDDTSRRALYGEILQNAEPEQLLTVIRTLHTRSETLRQKKKRLPMCEEKVFHDAERMLHGEIAYVAGIKIDEVSDYIEQLLANGTH